MDFNFGAKPFKFDPPRGFVAVCQANRDTTSLNPNSGVAVAAPIQLKSNAPQAIIIEASYHLLKFTIFLLIKNKFKIYTALA